MVLLSEIDPYLNAKVLKGNGAFNMNNYHPRYWLINGRAVPGQHRRQLRQLAAHPAVRVAGDDPPA